jgi:hypothetical protein
VLTELAQRASAQPPPPGAGKFHYVHTRGWYLHADADIRTNEVRSSGIATVDREQWMAGDGSGRLNVTGMTMPPNRTFGPGGLTGHLLPADLPVPALRSALNKQTPAAWVQAEAELWQRQAVSPALQSGILTILASQPGLTLRGETVDREGRPGIAISADDDRGVRTRHILVIDRATGALLDSEEVVLENSELPVRAPATISYTVAVSSGYTATTGTRP